MNGSTVAGRAAIVAKIIEDVFIANPTRGVFGTHLEDASLRLFRFSKKKIAEGAEESRKEFKFILPLLFYFFFKPSGTLFQIF